MKKILKFTVFATVLLILAGKLVSCEKNNGQNEEVFTLPLYSFGVKDKLCGYLLKMSAPTNYLADFVWAKNLPEEYLKDSLPISITFHYTGNKCRGYPIINIIYEEEKSEGLRHVKTELGGGIAPNPKFEGDTVIVSYSKGFVNVFCNLIYICMLIPFETQIETIDDVMYIYISDLCVNYNSCYSRCIGYYTFDFIFQYQGEFEQKYKIMLFGPWRNPGSEEKIMISEGIISTKKN